MSSSIFLGVVAEADADVVRSSAAGWPCVRQTAAGSRVRRTVAASLYTSYSWCTSETDNKLHQITTRRDYDLT